MGNLLRGAEASTENRKSGGLVGEFLLTGLPVIVGMPSAFVAMRTVGLTDLASQIAFFWVFPTALMMALVNRLRKEDRLQRLTRPVGVASGYSATYGLFVLTAPQVFVVAWAPFVVIFYLLIGGILLWLGVRLADRVATLLLRNSPEA
jgi:cytochrome b subunit of formate dehydrogenase